MYIRKKNKNILIDSKYSLIKNLYEIPTYYGLPKISVFMAFGGNYYSSGFNASGAGISPKYAKLAATGEYVERYCCLHPDKNKIKKDIYYEQKGFINPDLFNQYTNSEYNFQNINLSWVKGINLLTKESCYIPAEAAFLSFADNKEKRIWITNSTGAACGDNYNQVIWKGLAEAFERDAVQFTWRTGLKLRKINYEKNLKVNQFYTNYIKSEGIKFNLFELKMDWNIPAVFGIAEFMNGSIVTAASVRSSWTEACEKTLIELSQSIIGYASLIYSNDRIIYDDDFSNIKNYKDHSILYFNKEMKKNLDFLLKSNEYFSIPENDEKKPDEKIIKIMLEELLRLNKSVYFIDMTLSDIDEYGWKVGRIIIPEFLDIEPGFIRKIKNNRILEVKDYLINLGIKKEDDFTGEPKVPHPFP
ncbi:MAG: YcaO-like family protein [Sarcina sp.]